MGIFGDLFLEALGKGLFYFFLNEGYEIRARSRQV
jgi:hypothetical protein